MLYQEEGKLIYRYDAEELWIEAWGENALRVRATKDCSMPKEDWALIRRGSAHPDIQVNEKGASLTNGKIRAEISEYGKIVITNADGNILLEEYARNRRDVLDKKCSAIEVEAREFQPIVGGDYHLTVRFESQDVNEKIYGMGQYQQPYLDLKGLDLELAHRNSQASVPFAVSSRGYGFLWNNPGVGRAVFGKNIMSFEAYSTKAMDYWVVAGDTPAQIEEAYAAVTGTVPMMPEYGLGFWQCKLRYQTQEELLTVAREYKRRNLPIDLIVIDFFHWPKQGEWKFDPKYWPDPEGMCRKLKEMGVQPIVSIWPTINPASENYREMNDRNMLVRTESGQYGTFDFYGQQTFIDVTDPRTRSFVWDKVKKNYYDKGIHNFWLDEAEPEVHPQQFSNLKFYAGNGAQTAMLYPYYYSKLFYEGLKEAGEEKVIVLTRAAYPGSQKYGSLVWNGDIASTFLNLRMSVKTGLSMAMSGIPWWNSDIGGFHSGDTRSEYFRELIVRWAQFGVFCPVMRLHGARIRTPDQTDRFPRIKERTGGENEIWSFGDENYKILAELVKLRERLKPYICRYMDIASKEGKPIMRPMFFDYYKDPVCYELEDQYMFGEDILFAPITEQGCTSRKVYLPEGSWQDVNSKAIVKGEQWIECEAPIDKFIAFVREGAEVAGVF